ncbi:MAG TPA: 50S ribosomal protein L25/general stress protein Ctc [Cytophagaceae bacterium]|jgi:large subunit ribosomal protein L25|nr:50S ribosomal protein L25/general stress protein Ctc [Cytophagaceae bacterium]
MKSLEVIGFKRANLGKVEAKQLRQETNVPCVLYGGAEQVHFHTPAFLFRDLIYSGEVHTVALTVDGKKYKCILQDVQFHPVNEQILHVDFLELNDDKIVKIEIPVKLVGTAVGVIKGGKLVTKLKKVTVKALPANLPDFIEIDVTNLEVGKSAKVGDVKLGKYTILNSKSIPLASVVSTRELKQAETTEVKGAAKGAKK